MTMAAAEITSTANPRVKAWAALRERSGRRSSGRYLIEGGRELRRALEAGIPLVEILCCLLADMPFDHELTHLYEEPFDDAPLEGFDWHCDRRADQVSQPCNRIQALPPLSIKAARGPQSSSEKVSESGSRISSPMMGTSRIREVSPAANSS